MQRVKHFEEKSMFRIEGKINDFIRTNNVKIINASISVDNGTYYALVIYEK